MDSKSDPRLIIIQDLWDKQNTWTQGEAAAVLDFSQSAFNQYLHGKIPLNLDTIIKFAKFFGVKPSKIDPNLNF